MKRLLFSVLLFFCLSVAMAQAPQIEGNEMICPYGQGTAHVINPQPNETYQWYYQYAYSIDTTNAFLLIEGANQASFTYDWYTYDQTILKVVISNGGQKKESNTIQINSWVWLPLMMQQELNDSYSFNPDIGSFELCTGGQFSLTINKPPYDTGIQWYKDSTLIESSENMVSITVSQPGIYYVKAAPSFCPNNIVSSMPIRVIWSPTCGLADTKFNLKNNVYVYPNPAKEYISVMLNAGSEKEFEITDLIGKILKSGKINSTNNIISITDLPSTIYVLKLKEETLITTHKIIKN